jgi:hypothetical protein
MSARRNRVAALSAVVTLSVPIRPLASRSPVSPVTVVLSEPLTVRTWSSASAVASTLTVSLALASVTEAVLVPVMTLMLSSLALPVVTAL